MLSLTIFISIVWKNFVCISGYTVILAFHKFNLRGQTNVTYVCINMFFLKSFWTVNLLRFILWNSTKLSGYINTRYTYIQIFSPYILYTSEVKQMWYFYISLGQSYLKIYTNNKKNVVLRKYNVILCIL